MKIILCDTNIIFPIFARIIKWELIDKSSIFELAKKHEVYISTNILEELDENLEEQLWLILKEEYIYTFVRISNIKIHNSNAFDEDMVKYVNDRDDAQILQDAVDIKADYILSRNIKDFDIRNINQRFQIKVIWFINEELLN